MKTGYVVRMLSRPRQVCAWVIGPLAIGLVCGAVLGTEHESRASACPPDESWSVSENKADDAAQGMRWPTTGILFIDELELDDENGVVVTVEFATE